MEINNGDNDDSDGKNNSSLRITLAPSETKPYTRYFQKAVYDLFISADPRPQHPPNIDVDILFGEPCMKICEFCQ